MVFGCPFGVPSTVGLARDSWGFPGSAGVKCLWPKPVYSSPSTEWNDFFTMVTTR